MTCVDSENLTDLAKDSFVADILFIHAGLLPPEDQLTWELELESNTVLIKLNGQQARVSLATDSGLPPEEQFRQVESRVDSMMVRLRNLGALKWASSTNYQPDVEPTPRLAERLRQRQGHGPLPRRHWMGA